MHRRGTPLEITTATSATEPSSIAAALAEHDALSRHLGDGGFPSELDRFCWGAFFFPWLWAIRRRVWWLLAVWAVQILSGPLILRFLPAKTDSPVWQAFSMIASVVLLAFFVWLGVNGNRLAWKAAARANPSRVKMTVGKVINGESVWITFGVLTELAFLGGALWAVTQEPAAPYELWSVAAEIAAVALAVYVSRNTGSALWRRVAVSI
jgi:hypothetical protein